MALNLNAIEMLVLQDLEGSCPEGLYDHVVLDRLSNRGLVRRSGERWRLTDIGRLTAYMLAGVVNGDDGSPSPVTDASSAGTRLRGAARSRA